MQMTKINGVLSKESIVTHGVPQGSILGPLLFTLYVNDLPEHLTDGFISLYADDTALCASDDNPESLQLRLSNLMQTVSNWYLRNKLSINTDKMKLMLIGTPGSVTKMENVNITIDGIQLEKVRTFNYLGVKLDHHLTFKDHVAYVNGKTFSKIRLLGRLCRNLDWGMLMLLYKTLILPVFDYGDVIYHRMSKQDAESLQRLQNSACRAILKCDMYSPIDEMHDKLDISKLYQRRCQHIATRVHKFKNGNGPPDCRNMITEIQEIHDRTTRQTTGELLYIAPTCLKMCERDFAYCGPIIWNQIPLAIRKIGTTKEFKTEINKVVFA